MIMGEKMNDYPSAYIEFLVQFHGSRDYFECHEILEEFWKEEDKPKHWQVLIQLAVAVYHERQNNEKGSLRLYKKVLNFLRTNPNVLFELGIDADRLKVIVKNRIRSVLEDSPYEPLDLPLIDENLTLHCKQICEQQNIVWCGKEDLENEQLIFRHKFGDRSPAS